MSSLNKSDLKDIKMFLARTIARGYSEEERLFNLIEKIDKQLHKENTHGINGTARTASKKTEVVRSAKDH